MEGGIIKDAFDYVEELFRANSGGHDAAHSVRVYKNAMLIASKEPPCDTTVVALAALLHDADDHKLFNTENNENARAFLSTHGADSEMTERICKAIDQVSFSKNRGKTPSTPEARIVQDADRLDAIGAVGIARTFAYGGEHGRSLEMSIQHFYDKLLLLSREMNTDTAKELARSRHEYMEGFLKEFENETKEE